MGQLVVKWVCGCPLSPAVRFPGRAGPIAHAACFISLSLFIFIILAPKPKCHRLTPIYSPVSNSVLPNKGMLIRISIEQIT